MLGWSKQLYEMMLKLEERVADLERIAGLNQPDPKPKKGKK